MGRKEGHKVEREGKKIEGEKGCGKEEWIQRRSCTGKERQNERRKTQKNVQLLHTSYFRSISKMMAYRTFATFLILNHLNLYWEQKTPD